MNLWRLSFALAALWITLSLRTPVGAAEAFTSIYITEFLADNQRGLQDEDGDRPGWIELYNGGGVMMNLAGWFLTDSPTNLTKWRFPRVALLPDKYMVVFASAKARSTNLAELHTNFRLATQGGYLALVNRSTNVVSEFGPTYPRQSTDVSFGSVRSEPAIRGPFVRPTPGRPNATSGAGFAPEVNFSRSSRNFTDYFVVELSTSSKDSLIRYTLDGSLPNTNSAMYAMPIVITNTMQIRARAYADGKFPGPPRGETYLKLHTNVLEFTSSLPVLVMHTLGIDVPTSARSSLVHLSFHEPVNGRTSLTNPPALSTRAGFHVRGSTSSGMPQQGFAVEFLDEFNQEKNLSPVGLPAESDWILYAPNAYDPVLIHNPFIHQLSRDMGRYSPRTRFVEAFVVRGSGRVREVHYNGIYVLEEKIKIGKNRVNIDRLSASDVSPPQVTGGYLFKFDRLGPDEGGFSAGEASMVYVEPKEQVMRLPQRASQRNYLNTFFNDFEQALHGTDWKDHTVGYRAYLDVDAAIDFHVLEVLSGNVDAIVLSTHFHKPRNGKIIFGPHWDFDRALGSTDGRDDDPRVWNTGPFFGGAWWPRLFTDPDFWQQWVDRWQKLRGTHFSLTNLHGLIDRLTGELREAQPRQYKRWDFQPRGGAYHSEIEWMKNWLSNRVDFIDQQLVHAPRFSRSSGTFPVGFRLSITAATNATIYYTLDGSDPRLPQGAVSSNAITYDRPIQLQTNHLITARAHNPRQRQRGGPPLSTPWSGPSQATFTITSPQHR